MAEAAVSFLLQEVEEVVKGYHDLISGAEQEFHQLNNELGLLKAFLKDVASKSKEENLFREMERQIREVVYEVEDTIDTCLTKASKNRFGLTRFMLAKEVRSLRQDKVKPVFDAAKMKFVQLPGTGAAETRMKVNKDQSIRQDRVVGFEDEEATITGYLMQKTNELDVISIIGMPGLGKTTLTWKIFRNENICYEFPIRIWVYVSEKFNYRDMYLNILKKFTSQDMSGLSDRDLVLAVRGSLEREKFLLVMDDVWSVEAWRAIRDILPANNEKGKVLITSRDLNVGTHANVSREPHKLRFLTKEESWDLMQYEVFGKRGACPPELKDIGRRIANECDGVPLTIVVIGGILVDHFTRTRETGVVMKEWEKVSKNVNLALQNDKEKHITDVVALSYNRLSDDLRDCFVYMGLFPEDYEIPTETLIHLWIAEGFIQHTEGKSSEETALENLNDLINRNLVMADKVNPMGEVKTCRVHDMIRAFCKSKAVEQSLFHEMKKSNAGILDPPVSDMQTFHRLCLHSDLKSFLSAKPKAPRLRSFLCFLNGAVQVDPKYISTIPDAFELLRVLDSKSIKFHQFPQKILKLIHLRYVTLSIDGLTMLPEAISLLWNLQTLVVDTKSHSIKMKANIWKMVRLRHFKTKAAIVLDTQWEGEAGENLQILSRLSPESCTAAVSRRAHNLKSLGIRGRLATLLDNNMSLENMHRLEKLKLVNHLLYETASENQLRRLPAWDRFPSTLARLTLSNTFLDWKHMSTLAKIGKLEVLKLKDNAFAGSCWRVVDSFETLQFLVIVTADFAHWKASTNPFPNLRCLVLKNCDNLKEIPRCLCPAKRLKKLEIDRLPKSAVDSAKKIEEAKIKSGKNNLGDRFKLIIGPACSTN